MDHMEKEDVSFDSMEHKLSMEPSRTPSTEMVDAIATAAADGWRIPVPLRDEANNDFFRLQKALVVSATQLEADNSVPMNAIVTMVQEASIAIGSSPSSN